jgi:hypothetical protein
VAALALLENPRKEENRRALCKTPPVRQPRACKAGRDCWDFEQATTRSSEEACRAREKAVLDRFPDRALCHRRIMFV